MIGDQREELARCLVLRNGGRSGAAGGRILLLFGLVIDAFYAGGDAGEELPGDGAGEGSDFVCGDVGAEEFDFIAGSDGAVIREGDDDLIHGDAADDGVALAADEDLGVFSRKGARVAIAVADADGG